MTTITYVGQSANSVSITYTDVPAGAEVVFVNQTSGAKTPAAGAASSGNGSADIPVSGLKGGQYHLLVQQSGQPLAQTVNFYLN